jgi:hypothetical protein
MGYGVAPAGAMRRMREKNNQPSKKPLQNCIFSNLQRMRDHY